MKKSNCITLILFLLINSLLGCGPTQESYDKLKAENDKIKSECSIANSKLEDVKVELIECRANVAELKNTPIERLSKARKLQEQGDVSEAKAELKSLIEKYPDSKEAQISENILAEIEKKREEERITKEKEKEAEIKRKRLGFKSLKVQSTVEVGQLELKINSTIFQNRWVVDRYSSEYRYYDAKRGYKFIVVDVSISSEAHNPVLPAIQVYAASSDELTYIGTLSYRFYKWEDYASYLGNDADYKNDFSRTKTIRFSAGLEISEKEFNKDAILVFVSEEMCFIRKKERFSRPAVEYAMTGCSYKNFLDVNQAEEEYSLIKIFNQNKL